MIEAAKAKGKMKQAVTGRSARPGHVMATEIVKISAEARILAGKRETIRRNLRRQKRGAQPPDPQTLAEIELSEIWKETGGPSPQKFLIYDSGPAAQKRALIFASPEQLRQLALADRYRFYNELNKNSSTVSSLLLRCIDGDFTHLPNSGRCPPHP